mmetsp:Transcript_29978/g.78976  ORF Transcript_29978/g.78976 Transcript_29978/m.78976 type:complete len:126 (-) Transcript_29978:284-661(-)
MPPGQSICDFCAPGAYGGAAGVSTCSECSAGSFSSSPGSAPNRPRVPRRTASGGAPHMMRRLSHSARMGPVSLRNATPPMMDHRPCFRDVPRPAGRLRCDACTMGTYGSSAGGASGRPLALNPEP